MEPIIVQYRNGTTIGQYCGGNNDENQLLCNLPAVHDDGEVNDDNEQLCCLPTDHDDGDVNDDNSLMI